MKVWRDGEGDGTFTASAVAIGVFDGLHLGHRAVLAQLLDEGRTRGVVTAVVTFDPPPAVVLAPERLPTTIATLDQRLEGFEEIGVDYVRVLHFDERLAAESARDFIRRVLVGELHATCVVVGEDFRFGHHRLGDAHLLTEVGAATGFAVVTVAAQGTPERWSSSAVRGALAQGDLDGAARVLGRPFVLRGVVVHGDARGAALGFATANLTLEAHQLLPREGVYAGALSLEGAWFAAAVSLGRRPQFYDEGELLAEVHVLAFTGDLYDATLDVVFLERLRDQATFESAEALVAQIERDVADTQAVFAQFSLATPTLLG